MIYMVCSHCDRKRRGDPGVPIYCTHKGQFVYFTLDGVDWTQMEATE